MGISTVYGSFLALDWIGVIATTLISMAAGILMGKVLVLRWSGVVLMIPWLWWTGGTAEGLFALVANALYWTAMIPELRQAVRFRTEGTLPNEQAIAEVLGMGSFWEKVSPYSLRNLAQSIRER